MNGSTRLPNDEVSSAPVIGMRVGRRIEYERALRRRHRRPGRSALDAAELGIERVVARPARRAARAAGRRSAPARRAAGGTSSRPRRRSAAVDASSVEDADALAQLRRLALEPEQPTRNGADLLQREGRCGSAQWRSPRPARQRRGAREPIAERAPAGKQRERCERRPAATSGRTGKVLTRDRLVAPVAIITKAMPSPRRAALSRSILRARPQRPLHAATVCSAPKRRVKFTPARPTCAKA